MEVESSIMPTRDDSVPPFKKRRTDFQYICTIIILVLTITCCLVNLTFTHTLTEVWVSILSACLGAILPRPKPPKYHDLTDN